MDANAWVVLLHVDRGRAIEQFAYRNAFGDLSQRQLCPSNPDARAYGRALIADVASRGVDAILMESFHFLPFAHGYHHERAFVEVAPLTSFLLSLCFCDSCARAAAGRGVDVAVAAGRVSAAIREGFRPITSTPVDGRAGARAALFGGELGGFLDARTATVTSLVSELVERGARGRRGARPCSRSTEAARSRATSAANRPACPPRRSRGSSGRSRQVAVRRRLEVLAYASTAERVSLDLEAYAQAVAGLAEARGASSARCSRTATSAANLRAKVEVATELGFDRVDFYHYGLAPLDALDWIKSALPAGAPTRNTRRRKP